MIQKAYTAHNDLRISDLLLKFMWEQHYHYAS